MPAAGVESSSAQRGPATLVFAALSAAFVISVPLCLVANNVRLVALDPTTYREGFEKYRASERTGLDRGQLAEIAWAFIQYFQGPPGRLEPVVTQNGTRRALFNAREVAHMEDVQRLMQLVFRLGLFSGASMLGCAVFLIGWRHRAGLPAVGRLAMIGSGLSLGLLLVVAALSLLDFGELFVRFHQLSFQNDFWELDPRRDYLIILFPEGFWFDVTLKIAQLTAIEALAVGAIGALVARL